MNADFIAECIVIAGTAAFALSAVLASLEKKVDIFTVIVLGIITAVGGGTMRDWTLNVPVFWSIDVYYIVIAICASLFGFFFFPLMQRRKVNKVYLYIDAIAAALFAIQGTHKAWQLDFGLPVSPILLGIITAIGGGIVRDVLLERPSLLLSKELYAIPITLGCILYTFVLKFAPDYTSVGSIVSICLIVYLRHLSIQKQVMVPSWAIINKS